MKNRLARLLNVLERHAREPGRKLEDIAEELGLTPQTVRRDVRDLREARAFEGDRVWMPASNTEGRVR